MIAFPNCKINLGLSIIAKRTDGYHALETVFYPITLTDVLEIIIEPETRVNRSRILTETYAVISDLIIIVFRHHITLIDFDELVKSLSQNNFSG